VCSPDWDVEHVCVYVWRGACMCVLNILYIRAYFIPCLFDPDTVFMYVCSEQSIYVRIRFFFFNECLLLYVL
jgi:hypothetical protein